MRFSALSLISIVKSRIYTVAKVCASVWKKCTVTSFSIFSSALLLAIVIIPYEANFPFIIYSYAVLALSIAF
ncbi:MAG: hypothetical protein SCALA701_15380 [Candidatus Scalindua sp.]|nr:MAG: hypothetical protein SCALA701_15380 [Candidatus Scalindua sp.]